MQSLVSLNADMMQQHQPLVDSLLGEAAALRQEEIQFAHAFAKLPKQLQTPELFELFFRDIHSAHAELVSRLNDVLDSKISEALAKSIEKEKELNAALLSKAQNMKDVRDELVKVPTILGELYRSLEKRFRGIFGGLSQEEEKYLMSLYVAAEIMRKLATDLEENMEVAEQAKK